MKKNWILLTFTLIGLAAVNTSHSMVSRLSQLGWGSLRSGSRFPSFGTGTARYPLPKGTTAKSRVPFVYRSTVPFVYRPTPTIGRQKALSALMLGGAGGLAYMGGKMRDDREREEEKEWSEKNWRISTGFRWEPVDSHEGRAAIKIRRAAEAQEEKEELLRILGEDPDLAGSPRLSVRELEDSLRIRKGSLESHLRFLRESTSSDLDYLKKQASSAWQKWFPTRQEISNKYWKARYNLENLRDKASSALSEEASSAWQSLPTRQEFTQKMRGYIPTIPTHQQIEERVQPYIPWFLKNK